MLRFDDEQMTSDFLKGCNVEFNSEGDGVIMDGKSLINRLDLNSNGNHIYPPDKGSCVLRRGYICIYIYVLYMFCMDD
jgi:hypothetical protein